MYHWTCCNVDIVAKKHMGDDLIWISLTIALSSFVPTEDGAFLPKALAVGSYGSLNETLKVVVYVVMQLFHHQAPDPVTHQSYKSTRHKYIIYTYMFVAHKVLQTKWMGGGGVNGLFLLLLLLLLLLLSEITPLALSERERERGRQIERVFMAHVSKLCLTCQSQNYLNILNFYNRIYKFNV